MKKFTNENIMEELQKCNKSPYYFATNYLTRDGKPFTTNLTENEFNRRFKELEKGTREIRKRTGTGMFQFIKTI